MKKEIKISKRIRNKIISKANSMYKNNDVYNFKGFNDKHIERFINTCEEVIDHFNLEIDYVDKVIELILNDEKEYTIFYENLTNSEDYDMITSMKSVYKFKGKVIVEIYWQLTTEIENNKVVDQYIMPGIYCNYWEKEVVEQHRKLSSMWEKRTKIQLK